MALDAAGLGALIKSGLAGLGGVGDDAKLSAYANKLGEAIVNYIKANATVTVTVTGTAATSQGPAPVTGAGTGTVS